VVFLAGLAASFSAHPIDQGWLASQYEHRVFDSASGLPADIVWSLEQDARGYLWLGTQNGLVRFDGVRFTTFNQGTDAAFGVNDVRVVTQAPDGSIWLGTYGGGALQRTGSEFSALTTEDGLAGDIVYDIHFARDGATWFATAGGVSRLVDDHIENFTAADGLVANRVFKIAEDDAGDLWFATLTGGVSRFDGEAFENFGEQQGLDSLQAHLLYFDDFGNSRGGNNPGGGNPGGDSGEDDGGMLIGTYAGGLYRAGPEGLDEMPRGELPADLSMHSILRDRKAQLWLGSYGGGLWGWTPDGAAHRIELPGKTPSHVFDLLEDREGQLWIATMSGLHRLRSGPFRPWGKPEGLGDSTFVVAEDPATGTIWAGSEGEGLFALAADGKSTRLDTEDGLENENVSALAFDAEGRLWIGTFGGGLHLMRDGTIEPVEFREKLPGRQVFAILEHSDGALWIATEAGVSRVEDGRIETWTAADGLPADLVRHLMEARDGSVWMSTPEGLARFDDGVFETWARSAGLADNIVSTTFQDERGVVWIGMRNGGLARLADGELFQYRSEQGMPQNSVLEIVPDARGNFWLSGLSGLVRVSRDTLEDVARGDAEQVDARLFNETDGLRSSRFMVGFQPAGIRARDGRIWFATNRGLVAFDPESIQPERLQTELIIEKVRVDGEPVAHDSPVQLPADARSLEIEYTAPRLHAANRLEFRYRLGNPDGLWQQAGTRRTAYFTNLPPGQKRFEVQAASALTGFDDPSNLETSTLQIFRAPLWYQTRWFYLAVAIAALLAGWVLYRIVLGQVRRRQQQLEALVDQRTRELSEALTKVERLSRIDGLTGVANRRYFEERLTRIREKENNAEIPISIIMIDIDRFKQYNDSAGHQAGDECLRKVATALESGSVRADDLVARYGGEEFVVLLPATDEQAAQAVAERIRQAIADLGMPHPDSDVSSCVTVSIGVATDRIEHLERPGELIERADQALYRAKRDGRNRIVTAGW